MMPEERTALRCRQANKLNHFVRPVHNTNGEGDAEGFYEFLDSSFVHCGYSLGRIFNYCHRYCLSLITNGDGERKRVVNGSKKRNQKVSSTNWFLGMTNSDTGGKQITTCM